MTDKEKVKAYDEALKKASAAYKDEDKHLKATLERIFPELNEDSNEMIKTAILNHLKIMWGNCQDDVCGIHVEDAIAWLERQGKQTKQTHFPKFTFDDVLALQCCMETVKKVQEDKELYERLNLIHSKMYDAYRVEKQDEQASLQNNENIDLIKILKDCPKGETFWSPVFGDIKFHDINQKRNFINVVLENGETWNINADGTISFGDVTSPEIMLYPSHEQRDWSKFTAPWYKKEKFDPKTLQPFDKVLARDCNDIDWDALLFSHINTKGKVIVAGCAWVQVIPYNDDTKHLVGTKEEAPEFYRYWEE